MHDSGHGFEILSRKSPARSKIVVSYVIKKKDQS
jgi:hypothetical protein